MMFRVIVKSYITIRYDAYRTITSSHESSHMIPQAGFLCLHLHNPIDAFLVHAPKSLTCICYIFF